MNKFARCLTGLFLAVASITGLNSAAHAGNTQFSLGLEGFYDQYREPGEDIDVKDNSPYGSITAGMTYTGDNHWFIGMDGRGSYGRDHYSSVSGSTSGSSQWEGELRLRTGLYFEEMGGTLAPYVGLGGRFFYDNGAGSETNLGFAGYDRSIDQLYVPVGAAWSFHSGDWSIVPVAEYDQLIYGRVFSQLSPITGFDVTNNQHSGWGLRGELMFGRMIDGHEWQIGPFVRYWNIDDSDHDHIAGLPAGAYFLEPHNTRLQTGLAIRVKF